MNIMRVLLTVDSVFILEWLQEFTYHLPFRLPIQQVLKPTLRISIFVFFLIFCVSCDEIILPTESLPTESPTTFQISNNLKLYPPVEFIDGSLWEVMVYYYIGKDVVKVDSINPILTDEISAKIEIPSKYEKIKFSFQLAPKKSQYYFGVANCRRYSENFINLDKGKNVVVEINDLSSINLSL